MFVVHPEASRRTAAPGKAGRSHGNGPWRWGRWPNPIKASGAQKHCLEEHPWCPSAGTGMGGQFPFMPRSCSSPSSGPRLVPREHVPHVGCSVSPLPHTRPGSPALLRLRLLFPPAQPGVLPSDPQQLRLLAPLGRTRAELDGSSGFQTPKWKSWQSLCPRKGRQLAQEGDAPCSRPAGAGLS